jgi:hypothetical protein
MPGKAYFKTGLALLPYQKRKKMSMGEVFGSVSKNTFPIPLFTNGGQPDVFLDGLIC